MELPTRGGDGRRILTLLAGLLCSGTVLADPGDSSIETVLVVLIDDFGLDRCSFAAPPGVDCPFTPTMDQLAATGAVFPRCYTMPSCKPARASLLTGRLPRVHGFGGVRPQDRFFDLAPKWTRTVLASPPPEDRVEAIGKWHLSRSPGHVLGAPSIDASFLTRGNINDYWSYEAIENGVEGQLQAQYATSFFADRVIDSLQGNPAGTGSRGKLPRVVFWAPHAGHKPLHDPPLDLVHTPSDGSEDDQWRAMIEALDTELGRVLASLDPEVREGLAVMLVSDNGTPKKAHRVEQGRGKGTTHEGGIRVPLVVCGPGIEPGARPDDLVSIVDLLPTVTSMLHPRERQRPPAGTDAHDEPPTLWSRLASGWQQRPLLRRTVLTESFSPNLPEGGPPQDGKLEKWKVAAVHRDGWKLRVDWLADSRRQRQWYRLTLESPWEVEVSKPLVPEAVREELEWALESGGRWD